MTSQPQPVQILPGPPATCDTSSTSVGTTEQDIATAADVFKALADPMRLRLYLTIQAATPGSVCVCDLPELGLSAATVSHHLRKLREAGLVTSERRGTWVHYEALPLPIDMSAMLTGTPQA